MRTTLLALMLPLSLAQKAAASPAEGERFDAGVKASWALAEQVTFSYDFSVPLTGAKFCAAPRSRLFIEQVTVRHGRPSQTPIFTGDQSLRKTVDEVSVVLTLVNGQDRPCRPPLYNSLYTDRSFPTTALLTRGGQYLDSVPAHETRVWGLGVSVPVGTSGLVLRLDTFGGWLIRINLDTGRLTLTDQNGEQLDQAQGREEAPSRGPRVATHFSVGLHLPSAQEGDQLDLVLDEAVVVRGEPSQGGPFDQLRLRVVALKRLATASPSKFFMFHSAADGRSTQHERHSWERRWLGRWQTVTFPLRSGQREVRVGFGDPLAPSHIVAIDLQEGKARLEHSTDLVDPPVTESVARSYDEHEQAPDTWRLRQLEGELTMTYHPAASLAELLSSLCVHLERSKQYAPEWDDLRVRWCSTH